MSHFIIETKGLTKRFGKQLVVNNMSLQIPVGSIYGLLGPNGAGKSTTLKLIAGLVKPFSLKELMVRIEAHLRREGRAIFLNQSASRVWLKFKDLAIDLRSRQVQMNQIPIPLTKREFDIVELLAQHPGQVFSKEQIYEKIWGYDAEGDSTTITKAYLSHREGACIEFDLQ